MSNLNEHAQNLAQAIEDSEEFSTLKKAYEMVLGDEEAKALFEKFRQTQFNIHEKQSQGMEITEDEVQAANAVVAEVQQNETISNLINSEQVVHDKIGEISQIITASLEKLYKENT